MSGSMHTLKVSQELVRAYAQRRNSHYASASGDREHGDDSDPYAFVEGDEEFSFTEKKDKSGSERDGNKKNKVGSQIGWMNRLPCILCILLRLPPKIRPGTFLCVLVFLSLYH